MKKRTRDAEEDINKLQLFERNVETWKIDIEQRMADKFAQVTARFERNDIRHEKFVKLMEQTHADISNRIFTNDTLIKDIYTTLAQNKEERSELTSKTDFLQEEIGRERDKLDKKFDERCKRLLDK